MLRNRFRSQHSCQVEMGSLDFFNCVLFVLVAVASGQDCFINPETGLRRETLFSISFSYEELSQCADPAHCDDSTPGTGHKLFSDLTEDLIAVERCYSFCYTNVRMALDRAQYINYIIQFSGI